MRRHIRPFEIRLHKKFSDLLLMLLDSWLKTMTLEDAEVYQVYLSLFFLLIVREHNFPLLVPVKMKSRILVSQ
jgi:hypothetical protein